MKTEPRPSLDYSIVIAAAIAVVFAMGGNVAAEVVSVQAAKDNTLYETATGNLSNGAGEYFFVGRNRIGERRRALIVFDLASVPAGATINSVVLTLNLSRVSLATARVVTLHRLSADWGEGTSNAPFPQSFSEWLRGRGSDSRGSRLSG